MPGGQQSISLSTHSHWKKSGCCCRLGRGRYSTQSPAIPCAPMALFPDSLMEPPLLHVLLTPLQQLMAGEVRGGTDTLQHLQQTGLTAGTRASAGCLLGQLGSLSPSLGSLTCAGTWRASPPPRLCYPHQSPHALSAPGPGCMGEWQCRHGTPSTAPLPIGSHQTRHFQGPATLSPPQSPVIVPLGML